MFRTHSLNFRKIDQIVQKWDIILNSEKLIFICAEDYGVLSIQHVESQQLRTKTNFKFSKKK